MIWIVDSEFDLALSLCLVHRPLQILKFGPKFRNNWIKKLAFETCVQFYVFDSPIDTTIGKSIFTSLILFTPEVRLVFIKRFQGPNLMNLIATSLNYLQLVQIWTTDSKLKIKEGFESVIKSWIGGRHLKFIKVGPTPRTV